MSILKEIPYQQVYKKRSPAQHSIYEILQHMLAWRTLFVKRLNGDGASKIKLNSLEDWPTLPADQTAGNWNKLLQQLSANQQQLVASLQLQQDKMLEKEFLNTKASLETHLIGILQYDIYHIGQIAFCKS